jgi:2-polyprenyl-3-methyl-5-hydroxy-6-metoxy-1,4-benzoquinol methylase
MSEIIEGKPSRDATPWETPWPSNELEHVPECPVCGSGMREILHENLVDNVFFTAPGRWNLHRCLQCGSGYLDPRPDERSIGKAYATYYTHDAGKEAKREKQTSLHRLKPALFNGYSNQRYGTQREPAVRAGAWLARWIPRQREKLDAKFRYLPKPVPGQKLLDIGCGNGTFLILAHEAGWDVTGIDPDPKAVDAARQRGLDVAVGSLQLYAGMSNCFDAITLSHVIEHLHQPDQMIQMVYRLLKPGGIVFIDTPNIESKGAKFWGSHWRGLETPRHLAIFSPTALVGLLTRNAFENIRIKRRKSVRKSIYLSSLRMRSGASPYSGKPAKLPLMMRLRLKCSIARAEDDEFLTLVASKRPAAPNH